ncbi:MAG: aminoacetone oxidase family FAD-binding enzyme [Kiritimatiellales bacterium]|nr:aminoacetone oxidase family FAD-binding enzyme [Kiritimatiellales bacterium]
MQSDLIIIGGGAAGLMAGCAAGELGLRAVVLERKHKPGRKLLMCGNSRCNLTINISAERMLQMFGDPVGPFLEPAIKAFPPSALQRWFAANGLKTVVKTGNKVYPCTENASDVLHFFTDFLRDKNISLACSAVVQSLEKTPNGFRVETDNFTMESRFVLVATGGVSYPKTGSVGDGQKLAEKLGHSVTPLRGGLVGFEVDQKTTARRTGQVFERVRLKIISVGKEVAETRGTYEIEKWGIGGTAVTDASRIIARRNLQQYIFRIEFEDGRAEEVKPLQPRSIKEAMVTVGGVALGDVDFQTLESKKCPGLYFAGELLDIDGPTGGYNLQAAFATARLAVESIAKRCGKAGFQPLEKPAGKVPRSGKRAGKTSNHWKR